MVRRTTGDSWGGPRLRPGSSGGWSQGNAEGSRSQAWTEASQRPTRAVGSSVGSSIVTEQEVVDAGVLGEVQRDRVIRAEHSAAALQGVPAQRARRLQLAHLE